MQKEDLRVIKTKMNIENAFLNLFYQKEIEQISVKEITTIAQIARKTFYLHYLDKYDLLEKIFIKRLEKLREICRNLKVENLNLIIDEWLEFFYRHQKFYISLFVNKQPMGSRHHLIQFLQKMLSEVISPKVCAQRGMDFNMTLNFLGYGLVGMIDQYLMDGEKERIAIKKHIMTLLNTYRD
ncbi:TetR/AcrR family transcriptional regulator C-terminal domain-containing protein [Staphylococcus carnosus]|uniref:TetR/AcrR family transcriptional regulator C-terminal domain-containing protein n=2 Tax=Staphylococcus carnosus TaxID=1281 RepID=UPI000696D952|nr:TetR/AcrR family transcriptional regulator C-terminal domain-containing protein [Staphylococcus carnosus]QQS85692.1 TetR/AcrR family transcriptional regulator C-terminal domain-containing protein [Staphylococcus carnosus]QRQ05629.1 TetR/AcrR family transcriptional regulator C-terminal domain-containing protein [Staphylococcus carnosus]UTB82370.1 hypothetical protein A2I67_03265 [Staphylococcus carnosus]UTC00982.1 hypothetical protein A7E59_09515 [Staphylococcus carnosus]UTC02231.1 hypotheti